MGTSTKILRKANIEIEGTAGFYQEPNVELPFTTFEVRQNFDTIADESIVGVAFPDLPVQGVRKVGGAVTAQVDVATIAAMLEAVTGDASSPYDCGATTNLKTLSIVALDEVKTYKYAGCVVNSFELTSEPEGDLNYSCEVLGWKAETRDDTAFPTASTVAGERLVHHHAGGTNGYVRIGDQGDALAAGDNQEIGPISMGINWNFAEQFYNDQGTLQLLSGGGGRPEASFSFQISRHDADTFLGFRDNRTALQAEINYYATATAILLVQVPNFIIQDLTVTGDDTAMIDVTCAVARNGIGANYSNANMSFNTPIRFTLTNS